MTEPTPEQIAKLPKWAQEHLADCRRRADRCESELRKFLDGKTKTSAFIDAYSLDFGDKYWLPSDRVTFVLSEHVQITVSINDGKLHCIENGARAGHFSVWPRSGNVVELGVSPDKR